MLYSISFIMLNGSWVSPAEHYHQGLSFSLPHTGLESQSMERVRPLPSCRLAKVNP
jgi:hypothetical protein